VSDYYTNPDTDFDGRTLRTAVEFLEHGMRTIEDGDNVRWSDLEHVRDLLVEIQHSLNSSVDTFVALNRLGDLMTRDRPGEPGKGETTT
jgi:hypothetical protein